MQTSNNQGNWSDSERKDAHAQALGIVRHDYSQSWDTTMESQLQKGQH